MVSSVSSKLGKNTCSNRVLAVAYTSKSLYNCHHFVTRNIRMDAGRCGASRGNHITASFSNEIWTQTAERNSTKLARKPDLNLLYEVCVFSGRSEIRDGRPGLWLATPFSTSPLKPLNGIQRNLTGSKISSQRPLPSLCFPGRSEKWPPWSLIGWDMLDLSSETPERNSTILDRKQDLNVLYQLCLFRIDRKKQRWPPWPLIGSDIFEFSETADRIQRNLTGSKISTSSTKFMSGWSERHDGRPGLWLARTFSTSLKPLKGIQRHLTEVRS